MKNDSNGKGSSRRSFMKKSVVAAVAASNLTIFSGLVDAAQYPHGYQPPNPPNDPGYPAGCDFVTNQIRNQEGEVVAIECYWDSSSMILPCYSVGVCQVAGLYPGTWNDVEVNCAVHDETNRVLCDRVSLPQ